MTFNSNTRPPKFGKGSKTQGTAQWVCGCGTSLSKFILYCQRCKQGQKA